MAYTLYRTAHSTFVKETEDFTCGITTPMEKPLPLPVELGVTWFVGLNYKTVIEMIDEYEEGDICITNDPYSGHVSTHSPDRLLEASFFGGELVSLLLAISIIRMLAVQYLQVFRERFQKFIKKEFEFHPLKSYVVESSIKKCWISCLLMLGCRSRIGVI